MVANSTLDWGTSRRDMIFIGFAVYRELEFDCYTDQVNVYERRSGRRRKFLILMIACENTRLSFPRATVECEERN
jgi:hypothetical protein